MYCLSHKCEYSGYQCHDSIVWLLCRLMGRAAFRQVLVGKHGTLVALSQQDCQDSDQSRIAYIKKRLAEAGLHRGLTGG